MMPKCLQKVTTGVPKLHIVDGNAQIEKLRFDCAGASGSRFRHAGKHVKANKNGTQTNTRRIHDFFVKSDTKDCQNGHRFSPHFTVISSVIFKRQKKQKIILDPESRRVHLRHIKGKGGTTLGFPPLSRRCLLEAQGLLTNTFRIPLNWKCMLFICFCLFFLGGVWVALCRLHG